MPKFKLITFILTTLLLTGCTRVGLNDMVMKIGRKDKDYQYDMGELLILDNQSLLKEEVKNGIDISDAAGSNAFRMAIENGRATLAYALIDLGIDVVYQDQNGVSDLMYIFDKFSYSDKLIKFTDKFLEAGADITLRDNDGYSILDRMICYSHVNLDSTEIIDYLLSKGLSIDDKTMDAVLNSEYRNYGTAITKVCSYYKKANPMFTCNSCFEALFLQDFDYLESHLSSEWSKYANEEQEDFLCYAAAYGTPQLLEQLHNEYGMDYKMNDKEGKTLLMIALESNNAENCRFLIDKVDVFFTTFLMDNAFKYSIYMENHEMRDAIADKYRTENRIFDLITSFGGDDYMSAAIKINNLDSIQWLIDQGYKFSPEIAYDKLSIATIWNKQDSLRYLLSHPQVCGFLNDDIIARVISCVTNADTGKLLIENAQNTSDSIYTNALSQIILESDFNSLCSEKIEIIQLFTDYGVNLNANIFRGPLESAVIKGNVAVAECLLDNGADIEKKNPESGQTVLHVTASTSAEVMRLLIERGADLNALDNNGGTPLMYAVGQKKIPNIKLLLQSGADKNIKNKEEITAVEIARNTKDKKIISLLE